MAPAQRREKFQFGLWTAGDGTPLALFFFLETSPMRFLLIHIIHSVRWPGAGDWSGVKEKYYWLAGAGASGWSCVRGKYCWAGAGAGC